MSNLTNTHRAILVLVLAFTFFRTDLAPASQTPLEAATAYWPADDCTGHVNWITVPAGTLNPDTAEAEPATCTIRVSERELAADTPAAECWMRIHELGHLHGLPHSMIPLNVMYSGPNNTLRAPTGSYCTSRFPTPSTAAPVVRRIDTMITVCRNRKHRRKGYGNRICIRRYA